jgi:preprotein translocase subunit SecA
MDRMGYKEGEVIQHSMITKSIERAQKKVEENNFGIRKRLLEYDDVMNKQRNVVYTKRQHALFGERLALDLDNAFYSVSEGLVTGFREQNDYEGFKLAAIVNFGIDTGITKEDFDKGELNTVAANLYNEAINNYTRKKGEMARQALPVFQNVRLTQGKQIENVVVPFTDGRKGLNVLANLDKTINTKGGELANSLERTITLAIIDDSWKEHLRAMDDLKHSVQTAVYEQKDPLIIYKTTAFELFSNMDSEVNKDIVSFLCHAGLPVEQGNGQIREGKEQRTDMSKMKVRKDEMVAAGGGSGTEMMQQENDYHDPSENIKQEPIRVGPKVGRNDPCPCGSGKKFKHCHGKEA